MTDLRLSPDHPAQPRPIGRFVSKTVMDENGQWVKRNYILWREGQQWRDRPAANPKD